MSVGAEKWGQERKKKGMEEEAQGGLRSWNVLTLETWVFVCIWHSTSCHSTGLSTRSVIYQHTHLLTCSLFALEDGPRRPCQERWTPSKELGFLPPCFPKVSSFSLLTPFLSPSVLPAPVSTCCSFRVTERQEIFQNALRIQLQSPRLRKTK